MLKIHRWRLLRNIGISLISCLWIYLLCGALCLALDFLKRQERELQKVQWPNGVPFSIVETSQFVLVCAMIALGITMFFWFFILSNRLWPIHKKDEYSENKKIN